MQTKVFLCTASDIVYFIGIITLGDVIRGDGKGIAVITMSAVLWTFLGVVPFVQVGYNATFDCLLYLCCINAGH